MCLLPFCGLGVNSEAFKNSACNDDVKSQYRVVLHCSASFALSILMQFIRNEVDGSNTI